MTWAIRDSEDPNAPPLSYQKQQRAAASCRGLKTRAEERPCSLNFMLYSKNNLDTCVILQNICVHAWE